MRFFSEFNFRGNHAGTKARNDVETILRQYGARPINTKVLELRENESGGVQANLMNRLDYIQYYFDTFFIRNETVIIQYPILAFDIQLDYVRKLAKHNKVIFLIHDIQSLRREGYSGLEQEVQMLNLAFGLIVHNRFMEQKLKKIGVCVKQFYQLNCFDYLFSGTINDSVLNTSIVFAGNLEKSEFLLKMCENNPEVTFRFYGPGWKYSSDFSNAEYCGSFDPNEIPGKLQGQYGLIWDGKTTSGCTGAIGEYTKINNPHKLSLYIVAGFPVIAWSESAIAEFIHKNQIGILVNDIDNLQETLSNISNEHYQNMKINVLRLREQLIFGGYLRTVLEEIEGNR